MERMTGKETEEQKKAEEKQREEQRPAPQTGEGFQGTERMDAVPEKYKGHEEIEHAEPRTTRRFTREGESRAPGEREAYVAIGRFQEKSGEEVGYPTTGKSHEEAMTGEKEREFPAKRVEEEIKSGGGGEFGKSVRAGREVKGEREEPASQAPGEKEGKTKEEKTPETVMPGGSPEGYTKPWNAEEAQPMRGAGGELTDMAEKIRSGEKVGRDEASSLDTRKTGYEGELQRASDQEGGYGITGRSGELLRTGELKVGYTEKREERGNVQEQARTREELREMEMGTPEERERRARERQQQERQGASETGRESGDSAELRRSIHAGEIPAEPGMRPPQGVEPRRPGEYVSAFQALTGAGERIQILREDGSVEAFNPEKITQALEGAGASSEEAKEIARRVESSVTTHLTTEELDNQVRAQVRRVNPEIEKNWNAYKERSRRE